MKLNLILKCHFEINTKLNWIDTESQKECNGIWNQKKIEKTLM